MHSRSFGTRSIVLGGMLVLGSLQAQAGQAPPPTTTPAARAEPFAAALYAVLAKPPCEPLGERLLWDRLDIDLMKRAPSPQSPRNPLPLTVPAERAK